MLYPYVLHSSCWENHTEFFKVANGEIFETSLITKKSIGIQFFLNCIIWQKFVGSSLPNKDLLIGFDIFHLVKKLHIKLTGIKFKQIFLPYTNVLRLYTLSYIAPLYSFITQKFLQFCPENHS